MFVVMAGWFTPKATNPATRNQAFNIDSTPGSNFKFWIVTWEAYDGKLWIGQPPKLDRKTFNRVTGCEDPSIKPPPPVITPEWTIRSVWDQRVVIQRSAGLINPPANECSTSGGGRVFSLGEFALAPGRYQFEIKFSSEVPESMSFPAELNISCCGKFARTALGELALFFRFGISLLLLVFAFLTLVLFIRGTISLLQSQIRGR
jgi:hypothetical protein